MEHAFNIYHAKEYGIEAAILIKNIHFWIERNKANDKHFYEGRHWTYNSVKGWAGVFPYITIDVIRKRLDMLVTKGVLLKGFFNSDKRDRTAWYTIDFSVLHLVHQPNALGDEANCSLYTDSKQTDVNKNDSSLFELKESSQSSLANEVIWFLNVAKKRFGLPGVAKSNPARIRMISARMKEAGVGFDEVKKMIEFKCIEWKGTKFEKFVRVETLFQPSKFQGYIEEAEASPKKTTWIDKSIPTETTDVDPAIIYNSMFDKKQST